MFRSMRRKAGVGLSSVALAALPFVATSCTPVPDGIPGSWTLTLNAGPSDLIKWGGWFNGTGPINSREQACYSAANNSLDTPATGPATVDMALTPGSTCGFPYTGAVLSSHDVFSQTYGAFEAMVNLPGTGTTVDNWPAFWLDGYGKWPVTGELDVMEGLNGRTCYHFHSPSGAPGHCVNTGPGWHTFGADWQPGSVTYYYDGVNVGTITLGVTSAPMYLILDYTTNGNNAVAPTAMQVAWVRAWESTT